MNISFPLRKKRTFWSLFIFALFIHLIAIIGLSTIKILIIAKPKDNEFVAPPIAQKIPPKRNYKISLDLMQKSMKSPETNPIRVTVKDAQVEIPEISIPLKSSLEFLAMDTPSESWNSQLAFDTELDIPVIDVKWLFGQSIRSKELGVIWDVSKSMHPYLETVAQEIIENFPDANIVLISGSGLTNAGAGTVLPIQKKTLLKSSKVYGHLSQSHLTNVRDLIEGLPTGKTFFTNARLDQATHHAFTYLIDLGVDNIYWFGDFQDPIEETLLSQLSEELVSKKICVFAHHPKGQISGKRSSEHMNLLISTMLLPSGGNQIQRSLLLN